MSWIPASVDMPDSVTLSELAQRAHSQDATAIHDLMSRVRVLAHRYCRVHLTAYPGGFEVADDVAQEVCLAVLAALPRYQEEGRPFEAFVRVIAARKVVDVQRAYARTGRTVEPIVDEVDLAPTPEERAMHAAEVRYALGLVESLPKRLRDLLVLRVVLGMSADETAAALQMTPGAVRVAQHRALSRLRQLAAERAPAGTMA